MEYWYQKPDAAIADYVRTVLVLKGTIEANPANQPLFTNGMPALLCRWDNSAQVQVTLHGQSVPIEHCMDDENAVHIIYFFKSFILGAVFGVSAAQLKNNPVALNPLKSTYDSRLSSATDIKGITSVLNAFIAGQIQSHQKECSIVKYATDRMMMDSNTEVLAGILAELKLTERTFQRIFKKYVGITPGQYRRVCQFHSAFGQLRGGEFGTLTDIAYSNGYFDQSHYIRSFKEFVATTPQEYLQFGLINKKD